MFLAFVQATSKFSAYKNYMHGTKMHNPEYELLEKVFKKFISYTALAI